MELFSFSLCELGVTVLVSHGSGSWESLWAVGVNKLLDAADVRSRPVVNARSPAPERIIARHEGFWERWERRGGNSSHMLEDLCEAVSACAQHTKLKRQCSKGKQNKPNHVKETGRHTVR